VVLIFFYRSSIFHVLDLFPFYSSASEFRDWQEETLPDELAFFSAFSPPRSLARRFFFISCLSSLAAAHSEDAVGNPSRFPVPLVLPYSELSATFCESGSGLKAPGERNPRAVYVVSFVLCVQLFLSGLYPAFL